MRGFRFADNTLIGGGRTMITACSHKVCGKEKNIWFPTKDRYSSVKRHCIVSTVGGYKTFPMIDQDR